MAHSPEARRSGQAADPQSSLEDARKLAVLLQEISKKAQDDLDTDQAENLASLAGVRSRDIAAVASAIEAALKDDEVS